MDKKKLHKLFTIDEWSANDRTMFNLTSRPLNAEVILPAFIFFVIGYIISSFTYNLYIHPLRKFPGPFWARCTNLWGRYQNLHRRKAHMIHAAHQKYGKKTVKLNKNKPDAPRARCSDWSKYTFFLQPKSGSSDIHV